VRIVEGFLRVTLPLVRDETLDFAIGPRPEFKLDSALAFRPLFCHEYVVVARKGHPLRNARSLIQLANADWIIVLPPAAPGGPLERAFSTAGLPGPQAVVQCESYNIAVALLADTDMLGIWPRRILAESFAREWLRSIELAESMPSYTVGIFTRADAPLTHLSAALAKAVTATGRRLAHSA
jgi:DNA-binding transcriptional LysR family regulator